MTYKEVIESLNNSIDAKFAKSDMHKKILNSKQCVLGVRTPMIRKLAGRMYKNCSREVILALKDGSWEETLLAGLLIGYEKDIKVAFERLFAFCERIDNWATCDCTCSSLKIFKKDDDNKFFDEFLKMAKSEYEFTARVGIIMLMLYYLKPECIEKILKLLPQIGNHAYYVDMAVAWLISFAIVKFEKQTVELFESKKLTKFVQNKAICKCRDSFRVEKTLKEKCCSFPIY